MRTRVLQEKNYAERMQNGVEPYLAAHAEEFYWERRAVIRFMFFVTAHSAREVLL